MKCKNCTSEKIKAKRLYGRKEKLTFDHIIPISKGGKSEFNNFVLACLSCNISKGNKDVSQWCKQKGIKIPKIIEKIINGP